jgi:hypothetical protein
MRGLIEFAQAVVPGSARVLAKSAASWRLKRQHNMVFVVQTRYTGDLLEMEGALEREARWPP